MMTNSEKFAIDDIFAEDRSSFLKCYGTDMRKDLQQNQAVQLLWEQRHSVASTAQILGSEYIEVYKDQIANLAFSSGVPEKYIGRQFLLHCPNISEKDLRSGNALEPGSQFFLLMLKRAIDHQLAVVPYEAKITLDQRSSSTNTDEVDFDCFHARSVAWQQARVIESQLHYMQNFRSTATRRLGLYYADDAWPFCYTSVAVCDRSYLHEAVCEALGQSLSPRSIAVLSRIYASRKAPRNSISYLISKTMRLLADEGFSVYITASNPFLGFSASSIAASNFVPFACAPVAYSYDSMGSYQTRRNRAKLSGPKWEAPPNFIFIKSLEKSISRRIRTMSKIVLVSKDRHASIEGGTSLNPEDFQNTLMDLRVSLEGIWDENTRYHKTAFDPGKDPISKGQCGVTSAYLARLLEKEGYNVLFCEGDVFFDGFPPILQHCWLRLVAKDQEDDIIIDITADQSGYKERVVCDTRAVLGQKGIEYRERYSLEQSQVGVDHVKNRLRILQGGLREQKRKELLS